MKTSAVALLSLAPAVHGAHFQEQKNTPMARVAQLLIELKARIASDGKLEQMSYDKYACWCEETLARKAQDISEGQELAKELQTKIIKLEGEIGSHGAEIKQLQKDIEANLESQRDATELREKEQAEFEAEETESENCLGALAAAIKALDGAGEGKGFLETMKEVNLLSVVAGVKSVLKRPAASRLVSVDDMQVLRRFLDKPADLVSARTGLAQVGNNPFGDYAPGSTQIQGILKQMEDDFTASLKKARAEELEAQKNHDALMDTKKQEQATLETTLQTQTSDEAAKKLDKAESNELMDNTKEQVNADETFFATTKSGCQVKSTEWSERSRLRTEELAGVAKAISILTDPDSVKTFTNSTTTFMQLSARRHRISNSGRAQAEARASATARLSKLAQQYHNLGLAQIAVTVKNGGHFDKVMASIDQMIADLRKEEQEDIEHRDRCQRAEGKNGNDLEDLQHDIGKAGAHITRLEGEASDLTGKVSTLEGDIARTESEKKAVLKLRNEEVAEFRQALKDDAEAVELLTQTIEALTSFYKRNQIPLSLLSKDPKYTVDQDKAPETTWKGADYGGRKDETHGVVAIIEMIREDVQKEMKTAQADDAKAEVQYEKERSAMQKTLDAQTAMKLSTEKGLSEVESETASVEEFKLGKEGDKEAENSLKASITGDCSWVKTHFESRRTKRQAEIQGLVDAKDFLAGSESGDLI